MLLVMFIGLQVMDAITTVAFLHRGVGEANPLIRTALAGLARPEMALALVKVPGISLAAYAWYSGRRRFLRRVNLLFALCVAWNLLSLWAGHANPAAG